MDILDLSYTEETKNIVMPVQSGETVNLQAYLDGAYSTIFAPHTGYEKPRNIREYNLVLSYLLLVATDDKERKKTEKIFAKIFSL